MLQTAFLYISYKIPRKERSIHGGLSKVGIILLNEFSKLVKLIDFEKIVIIPGTTVTLLYPIMHLMVYETFSNYSCIRLKYQKDQDVIHITKHWNIYT